MENLYGIGIIVLVGLILLGAILRPQPPTQPTTYVLLAPAPPKTDQGNGAGALVLMLIGVLIALSIFQV